MLDQNLSQTITCLRLKAYSSVIITSVFWVNLWKVCKSPYYKYHMSEEIVQQIHKIIKWPFFKQLKVCMMKNDEGRMPEWRVYVQQLRANEFCKNMNACVIYFNKKDKWKNGERGRGRGRNNMLCNLGELKRNLEDRNSKVKLRIQPGTQMLKHTCVFTAFSYSQQKTIFFIYILKSNSKFLN